MNKKIKKVFLFILVTMMMFTTMATSASAEPLNPDNTVGRLTLKGGENKTDSKYSAYKVLAAEYVQGQNVYNYSLTENFKNASITLEEITKCVNGSGDYKIDGNTADAVAAKLEEHVKNENIQPEYTLTANQTSEVSIGYYLVLETQYTAGYKAIKPMLVAVPGETTPGDYDYEVEVTLKEQPISTEKTIVESEQSKVDFAAQQVGQEITFEVVQDIPLYDNTYKNVTFKVIDTMSKGLTFRAVESVTLSTGTKLGETDYGFTNEKNNVNSTTTITFDFGGQYYNNVKNADKVTIRYKAVLNKDADFGVTGNPNEVYAEFGTDSDIVTEGTPDSTTTYSGALQLTKKGENNAALTGAEFTVYTDPSCTEDKIANLVTYKVNNDGTVTTELVEGKAVAQADANGVVTFKGLGEGTYYIKETKAPDGYVLLKDAITVKVTFDKNSKTFTYEVSGNGVDGATVKTENNMVTFDVQNTKGFTLPTTGGMGTYIFTICGVLLIVAAVVLFIRLKKKER